MFKLTKGIYRTLAVTALFGLLLLTTITIFPSPHENLTQKISDITTFTHDQIVDANYKTLVDLLLQPISEPKVDNLVRSNINGAEDQRANATLLILARNSDSRNILHTMKQIESTFNSKFNYPYVFLNDGVFTDVFKRKVQKLTKAKVYFESVAYDVWNQPDWIDTDKQEEEMDKLSEQNVAYASKKSYHNMCRYYSTQFYNHPRLQQFKYYWRFEPGTDYFCQLDYDVFRFMQDNDKVYGFNIALYDSEQTVKTLMKETNIFLEENPQYLSANPATEFVFDDKQHPEKAKFASGYSTCHFWSNFEIADMDFYRDDAYSQWVNHLESTGGFYYERWGDAPVHSVGVSLFANKDQVHWFRDIGYKHHPYANTPNSQKCKYNPGTGPGTAPGEFTYEHLKDQACLATWWNNMDKSQQDIY